MSAERLATGAASPAQLRAVFDSATLIYVLVDPMLGEPMPTDAEPGDDLAAVQAVRERLWQREVVTVALDPRVALDSTLHPYIVTLQGADDPWLADTLDIAHGECEAARAGGLASEGRSAHRISWLQSSLFAGDLAVALSPMLRVDTPVRTSARYLRLADRRVLDWLQYVVGAPRLSAQLGRIRRWAYLDAWGRLAQLKSPGEEIGRMSLSPEEWALTLRSDEVHAVITRWLGEKGGVAADENALLNSAASAHECYRRIIFALDQADQAALHWPARFLRPRDRRAWAALSLMHPGVESDPRVRAALLAQPEDGEPIETMHTLCSALRTLMLKGTPE